MAPSVQWISQEQFWESYNLEYNRGKNPASIVGGCNIDKTFTEEGSMSFDFENWFQARFGENF